MAANAAEKRIQEWLMEDDENSDVPSDDEQEDLPDDQIMQCPTPHDSESEQDCSENEQDGAGEAQEQNGSSSDDDLPLSTFVSYQSRNGTKWSKFPPRASRTRAHNIVSRPQGPIGAAKEAKSALQSFTLFFDADILNILVDSTNIYIDILKSKFQRDRDACNTDIVEMKAFIGMLLIIGTCRAGQRNLHDFWDNSKGTGVEVIYTTMSETRFRFLLRAIRFDDVRDRQVRQQIDRLAAIRQIISTMCQKCKDYYVPSEYLTIDEQLVAFRGRCGFVQYMPNKPAKFGIKIIMVVDVKYPYVYNFEIYAGMHPEGPFRLSNKVPDIIHRILHPLYGSGCNVTMDNWFTSVPVCKDLLTHKITTVGTLKKNKPEIPEQFKATQNKEIFESTFGFQPDCTLVSYIPKRKKVVLLLSTLHNDNKIDPETGDSKKPEIITFYNQTKCGVDIFDKMCRQYDVSRNSRRWPLTLFYNFVNLAGINGLVIYQMNNPNLKVVRRHYLQEVGFELARPLIERRIAVKNIPRGIKLKGRLLLGLSEEPAQQNMPIRSRVGRCAFCNRARDKSTRKHCSRCMKWICSDHQVMVCRQCIEDV